MNGIELFLLGRTLTKLGEQAIPEPGGRHSTSNRSVLIVAADIRENPGTSVGEIAERTGFPQSKVSACVARLREAGAVQTAADPADRRRLLIRPAGRVSPRVAAVRAADVADVLAAALGPDALAEVTAALDTLARHLTPGTVARVRT
ncbi:helix-turn-helix domain-containing protein [Longispora sp. K20-0274]|uniref:MarR family transcriptional regulator n=1 Tax=Longispora sp. K20-0274 TaxID=3088255 RepID=UPI003999D55A